MRKEGLINRLVKGIWALTGLKSSEFISLAKEVAHTRNYTITGSRLRGVMSSPTHKNYRVAGREDLVVTLFVVVRIAEETESMYRKVASVSSSNIEWVDELLDFVDNLATDIRTKKISNDDAIKALKVQLEKCCNQ